MDPVWFNDSSAALKVPPANLSSVTLAWDYMDVLPGDDSRSCRQARGFYCLGCMENDLVLLSVCSCDCCK